MRCAAGAIPADQTRASARSFQRGQRAGNAGAFRTQEMTIILRNRFFASPAGRPGWTETAEGIRERRVTAPARHEGSPWGNCIVEEAGRDQEFHRRRITSLCDAETHLQRLVRVLRPRVRPDAALWLITAIRLPDRRAGNANNGTRPGRNTTYDALQGNRDRCPRNGSRHVPAPMSTDASEFAHAPSGTRAPSVCQPSGDVA